MNGNPVFKTSTARCGWSRAVAIGILLSSLLACEEAPSDAPASLAPESLDAGKASISEPERLPGRSLDAGRRHLLLEVTGATLDNDLTLQVSFSNRSPSVEALVAELGGADFLLAEGEGRFSSPRRFSDNLWRLAESGKLSPGAVLRGELVFEAPQSERFELRFAEFGPVPLYIEGGASVSRQEAPASTRPATSGDSQGANRSSGDKVTARRRAARQAVLDVQATALEEYDLTAYLDTFVTSARSSERTFFENIRSLPLADVQLRLGDAGGASGGRTSSVELRYRLQGQPRDNPFVHALEITWQRTPDGPRAVQVSDDRGRPVPWRVPRLTVHRSHHFLLATEPRLQKELLDLAADAEAAYAALYQKGLPLDDSYFVHLVGDRQLFRRLAGRESALGVAIARHAVRGGQVTVDSRAFYVNGNVFARLKQGSAGAERRRITVTHELVHLALARRTRAYTPIWLKEGAAVFFSDDLTYDRNRQLVGSGLEAIDLGRLTRAPILGQHDLEGRRTVDEYVYAGNLVAYLMELQGRDTFLEFYGSIADLSAAQVAALATGGTDGGGWGESLSSDQRRARLMLQLAPRQLQAYYGFDLVDLAERLEAWMRLKYPA